MKQIHVVAGIFSDNEKVLIARRKKGKSLEGNWEFPGGKIEVNESKEAALERELKEELGINVSVGTFIQTNIHEYPNFIIHLHAFEVSSNETVTTSIDHDKIEWINPQDHSDYKIAPADIPILESLIKKR